VGSSIPCRDLLYSLQVLKFLKWVVPFSADLGHLQKNARFSVAF